VKIALLLSAGGWLGGVYYLRNLALALRALPPDERPEVVGVTRAEDTRFADVLELVPSLPDDADVVFPNWGVRGHRNVRRIGWVPDLQYRGLPSHFSARQRLLNTLSIRRFARGARRIVVSSEVVRMDLCRAFPSLASRVRVLRFTTVPDEALSGSPDTTVTRYGLPHEYVLIANQFWTHKNHRVAFEALGALELPLVCTGATADPRDPGHLELLLGIIDRQDARDRVHLLGVVPRTDYFQLLRGATVVMQPSLFEGWSSIVEDARAYGKRIVLSDIPVHREQNPSGAVFFDPLDPAALAQAIRTAVAASPPLSENDALAAQAVRVQEYGRAFVALARDAIAVA
jgi:glycosyltransferase involved in cell wall biosynthesis